MAETEREVPLRRGPGNPMPGLDEGAMREMWLAGVSAADIGRIIGCSKNTVIGRARRKGWDRKPSNLFERMDRLHAELDAVLDATMGIGRIPDSAVVALPRSRRMAG